MGTIIYFSFDCSSIWIKWDGLRKNKGVQLKRSPEDCYECISHSTTYDGYPVVKFKGTQYRLNRFMYCLFNGKEFRSIRNKVIRHTCDNRLCCSPLHLIEGWPEDNRQDMYDRGRQARGERVSSSKLTEEDVRYILGSAMDANYLADVLNVTPETIKKVINRETWKHVKLEPIDETSF